MVNLPLFSEFYDPSQVVVWDFLTINRIWVVVSSIFFLIFTPILGEDEPILTSIFFKGVGSTTNQYKWGPHTYSRGATTTVTHL